MTGDLLAAAEVFDNVTVCGDDVDFDVPRRLGQIVGEDRGRTIRPDELVIGQRLLGEAVDGRRLPHPIRIVRCEQHGLRRGSVREILDRMHVVEDPHATSVRRDDQIVGARLDLDIVHRSCRHVEAEGVPGRAAVEREEEPPFGAGVQHARVLGVFTHDAHEVARRQSRIESRPGPSVVGRAEHVRAVIPEHVVVECDVRRAGIGGAGFDRVGPTPVRCSGRCHVRPRLAAVTREVHETVVAPRPDDAGIAFRRCDAQQRVRRLGARDVRCDRAARDLLVRTVVACEVGAQNGPMPAFVRARKDDLAADERAAVAGERDWSVPVEAVRKIGRFVPAVCLGRRHFPRLRRARVVEEDLTRAAIR